MRGEHYLVSCSMVTPGPRMVRVTRDISSEAPLSTSPRVTRSLLTLLRDDAPDISL